MPFAEKAGGVHVQRATPAGLLAAADCGSCGWQIERQPGAGLTLSLVQRLVRRCGYDLTPRRKAKLLEAQLVAVLQHFAIDCVIDVGANVGQYARQLREWGYRGRIVSFEPPMVVELAVKDTPPVVKGATATNQSKEAILETGVKVRVPPFIAPGDVLRVDTRTGEYIERAKQ